MNRIPSVMKMHYRDKLSWFYVPFMVLGSSFSVNWIVGLLMTETPLYTGGQMSIFIYLFVMGILVLPQTFNFALGFSIRRNDYFAGTSLYGIISSTIISCFLLLMTVLEQATNHWGVDLHFFSVPYLNAGSYAQEWFIFFILTLTMFFGGLTIGSIYRRFKGVGMIVMTLAVIVLGTLFSFLANKYGWGLTFIEWAVDHTAFQLALWLIPVILIYTLVSYILIRKSTV
ncbi:hypothetical protein [Paenibacillus sp. NEAU-GSW1]|uniref:hypothetical protein n=1 Tax=Paenibacillus sp. NEAU-GSW1 TaxID=2682486 RepID=UPI0012E1792C|nr:hypothetical protein [Paenibacillus sp. NEAU-GSW1]MUT66531.1 hypothetical protein [Paenibacillus sp. NEAU-GSW1]